MQLNFPRDWTPTVVYADGTNRCEHAIIPAEPPTYLMHNPDSHALPASANFRRYKLRETLLPECSTRKIATATRSFRTQLLSQIPGLVPSCIAEFTIFCVPPCTHLNPEGRLGQERAVASHHLHALDAARDKGELLDAVVNVRLVVHDVLVRVVGHQLTTKGLQYQLSKSNCFENETRRSQCTFTNKRDNIHSKPSLRKNSETLAPSK